MGTERLELGEAESEGAGKAEMRNATQSIQNSLAWEGPWS